MVHTFCPLTTHSSPSRSALVVSPARSDPLPGSLNSWHHLSSPVTMGRSRRRLASGEPCSRMVGAARAMPAPAAGPTAPTSANTSATTAASPFDSPLPYHSVGQVGQPQPESASRPRHSRSGRSGSHHCSSHDSTSRRTSRASSAPLISWPDQSERPVPPPGRASSLMP